MEIFERDNIIDHAADLAKMAEEIMKNWEEKYEIVRQIRLSGLLLGVSFQPPEDKKEDKSMWYARAVRNEMLHMGVWAISDREENIRMYPALNMSQETLKEGLTIMENAISKIDRDGQDVGDSPAWPTGDAGF